MWRDKGWNALRGDILTFCKLLQFKPSPQQQHYLLRVQNIPAKEGCRLGLVPMDDADAFAIVATAMFYRALVYGIPSYVFYEFQWHAEKWVNSMAVWGSHAIDPLSSQLQVSKQRRFLLANGVPPVLSKGCASSPAFFSLSSRPPSRDLKVLQTRAIPDQACPCGGRLDPG